MIWSNFLHVYQPPTQKEIWVRRVSDESYRKVFSGLLKIPRARFTLNINGILCELLEKYGARDVIYNIRELLKNGQLELTGSAKFHAFLPYLPESEIERQIILNEESLKKYFGSNWKKAGFFSPEMAYSEKIARVAHRLGYLWMIADELALPAGAKMDRKAVYQVGGLDNFKIFFRERSASFFILSGGIGTAPALLRSLASRIGNEDYFVTAMDGETFGHHRPGLETLLFDLAASPDIEPVMVSDLEARFSKSIEIIPRDSTWASTERELKRNEPFVRWHNNKNEIHKKQWELTELALKVGAEDDRTRRLLDESLHSDQYWWASASPWWSLEMIERGAWELRRVVMGSRHAGGDQIKKADELYRDILYTGFDWQRSGKVDEISRRADEDVQERLEMKEKLFMTKEDYEQMIQTLEKQMKLSVDTGEYHRAAMLKDRITELKEEMSK